LLRPEFAGEVGPCPPTDKSTSTDYVYVMDFKGDKNHHMTKIWNAGWGMRELGLAIGLLDLPCSFSTGARHWPAFTLTVPDAKCNRLFRVPLR
jgi:hypothetical protein